MSSYCQKPGLRKSQNHSRKRKPVFWINVVLAVIALYASWNHYRSRSSAANSDRQQTRPIAQTPPPAQSLVETYTGEIKRNMTFSDVLSTYDFPEELLDQLIVTSKPIYDLRKLLVGNSFELERLPDGTLNQFLYQVDLDKNLKIYLTDEGYKAALEPVQYETQVALIAGTIQSSLFRTIGELQERDQLALDLSEIFSWDLDFSSDLRKRDHFKVAVEKRYLDGKFAKYGRILAAEFANRGKVYSAFRFTNADGRSGYYNAAGKSLKRDLLKTPLKFSRISSVFSRRRFHPLLKEFRPHMGIDYAAASGTQVFAAGDGRVRFAGWRGGLGRSIEIEHRSKLATLYGHLSRFASGIRAGAVVKQGQVIGYVGASGLATGPHLDYRVSRNGRFVNPASIKFEPSEPINSEDLQEFQSEREKWQSWFATLTFEQHPQVASASLASRRSVTR